MFRVCLTFAVLVGLAASAVAAEPIKAGSINPDPKSLAVPNEELSKARELVQKLGSDTFTDRESAERELAAMGRFARAALLDGVNLDPDPEVRARCGTLFPKANAEEMKARLETFLADTDGKYEHDLPGWHKLRAVVRGEWKMFGWTYTARPQADKAARELFIEFMQAPGGRKLLIALGGQPSDLGQLVGARKQELYNAKYGRVPGMTPRNPSVAEIGVVLFAESQVNARLVPRTTVITAIVTQSGMAGVVQGSDNRAQAMRAVMTGWFDSRSDAAEMYSALSMANNMQLNEAAERLASRMITTAGLQGVYKGQALATLVRLKSTHLLPAIERAFTDTTVLTTTIQIVNGKQERKSIEVRDAALAAAIVMTGQNPNDYGFDAFPKAAAGGLNFSYTYAKIHEDKRKEAFEKWKEWREKNP